jgi:enoyl-CoA hydratase
MSARVSYRCEDGIARITLDDGKVNVMSTGMLGELDAALDRAEADKAVVVLRSARPGIFSAGFDLKVFQAGEPDASLKMVRAGAELALRLMQFPRPTVGVAEGHAYPMGTFLLLACDVRIGAAGRFRMGLNEVAIGIAPPSFAIELARTRVHPAWHSRTVTLGEMYEPAEAEAAGFLDRLVPAEAVDPTLDEILPGLKGLHAASHALAKRRLRGPAAAIIREAIDRELTPEAYRSSSSMLASVAFTA